MNLSSNRTTAKVHIKEGDTYARNMLEKEKHDKNRS